jgi:TATA-box binding protein (TBP) (component of TFIID and TFIIIB)
MRVRNVDLDASPENEYVNVPTPPRRRRPIIAVKQPPLDVRPIEISSDEDEPLPNNSGDEGPPDLSPAPTPRLPNRLRRKFRNFQFINSCFQGNIRKRVNLQTLKTQWKGSVLKTTDPVMLIYKYGENTLLMFSTGKFRFMGPFHPTSVNAKKQLGKMPHVPAVIKKAPLQIQTCTVTFKLPGRGVHLPRLAAQLRRDNFEITFNKREFPAISMYRWNPMHVNVFYSGNVVVIGSKGIVAHVRKIYNFLVRYININRCWGEYLGRRWMRD